MSNSRRRHIWISHQRPPRRLLLFLKKIISFLPLLGFCPPIFLLFIYLFLNGSDLWPLGVVEEKVSCSLSLPSPPVDHNGRMGRGNSFSPPPLITPSYCSFFLSVFLDISLACQRASSSSLRSFLSLHKTIWFIHDPPSWSSLPLFCHSVIRHLFCLL